MRRVTIEREMEATRGIEEALEESESECERLGLELRAVVDKSATELARLREDIDQQASNEEALREVSDVKKLRREH